MKVRCSMCEHEQGGFCSKKLNNLKPIKIELNKPRACTVYKEDGLRVLGAFRKKEAHKKNVALVKRRNVQMVEAVNKMQEELAARKAGLNQAPASKVLTPAPAGVKDDV